MVKFAHIADSHLGSWKHPEIQDLNFQSFKMAIDACIREKVEFALIAGDLFDTAFPGIEILKGTFGELKRLKESGIPCFIIAGSHDYSVSGKTFLDVLEKAGFCKNVEDVEERNGFLHLTPTLFKGFAIYGYPGRKSGLEIPDLRRVKFNDAPGFYKIFMLHTTLYKVRGSLPIDAIETDCLPHADYYALGHIHIDYQYQNFVYPGPVYPNNFQEIEDLHHGGMYIVESDNNSLKRIDLKIKEVVSIEVEINNATTATEKIISELDKKDLSDKVVLLRVRGLLESGQHSDIKFAQIEEFAKKKNAYSLLRNTNDLKSREMELEINVENRENVEEEALKIYEKDNPSDFNSLILPLMSALSIDKQEGETSDAFMRRLLDNSKKVLNF